jgi:hypothetical protein
MISGSGRANQVLVELDFVKGRFLSLPGGFAAASAAVNDAPLRRYLRVRIGQPRFAPTLCPAARAKVDAGYGFRRICTRWMSA